MRSAGLSDVESILSFWRESAEGTNRQDDRPSVERLLNRDPDALLLAVVGKDIVGTVIDRVQRWKRVAPGMARLRARCGSCYRLGAGQLVFSVARSSWS